MAESTTFGKYRLIAELGHGGMADVFLAVQAGPAGSGFSKLTVIKRLRANLAEDPEFVEMLVDEARIAARLNHPNVVQTNEVGEVGNQYFIAMEYLDGQPFHRIQHRSTQRAKAGDPTLVTKEQQYIILMDALAGLHHAHELKDYDGTELRIVHRDITPHNIFVTYDGQVKVVDFGIAKAAGRASETRQGVVKGKVRYMAPEQAVGHDVDRRADVFAAGVMLWEIAAGRRMWKDSDDLRIVQALVAGELPGAPSTFDPTVSPELDRICTKALQLRPEERYDTADEFRLDLEQALAEAGQLVIPRRTLPAAVGELFKDKRTEIRAVIEKQLTMLGKPSGEMRAALPRASPESTPELRADSSSALSVSVAEPASADPPTELYQGPSPKKPRRGIAVAVAGVAALCIAGVVVWRGDLAARADASNTKANVNVNVNNANANANANADVSVKLTGSPSIASVRIDNGPPQRLPLDIKVRRDEREHAVQFEAEGFAPKVEQVTFARDVMLNVELQPTKAVADVGNKDKDKDGPSGAVAALTKPSAAPPPAAKPTAHTAPPVKPTAEPTTAKTAETTTATPGPASSDKKGGGRLKIDDDAFK